MGKIELRFEVDAELVEQARANGHEPQEVLERALRAAAADREDWAASAREKSRDPAAQERRAREWAEENSEAIAEFNRRVAERGLLSDYEPLKPRWMR